MKILLVITKSEIGGAQVFILNLARTLKMNGHDVEVAAGDGDYLFNELSKDSIPFHYLNSLKRNINLLNFIHFIYEFYKLLKKKNFQIVHLNSTNTLIGAVSAKLLNRKPKVIFTFHGLSLIDQHFNKNILIKYLAKIYFKLLMQTVDKAIFVSELNYKELLKERIVKSGEVIFNGLDESIMKFKSSSDARNYLSKLCNTDFTNKFIIGSVGRLAYPKNYEFLIENFSVIKNQIPNLKVIIIGDGSDKNKFLKRINELKLQNEIFLVGSIKDSYQHIKAFDVFTLLSRYEGLSISLIEALFAEIPILATNVGGNSEIVNPNTGQLFELDNIDDFLEKLKTIINNKDSIVRENISLKKKFDLNLMVKTYEDLYKKILQENN